MQLLLYFRAALPQPPLFMHSAQLPQQEEPVFLRLTARMTAPARTAAITATRMISTGLMPDTSYQTPHITPHTNPPVHASMMILNRKLTIHARMHCQTTRAAAHFQPSSRLTDAMAATQGV